MATYKVWAIHESNVRWIGHEQTQPYRGSEQTFSYASAFQINDVSKFEELTFYDDDPELNDIFLSGESNQYIGQHALPIETGDNGGSKLAWALAYKKLSDIPGAGVYKVAAEVITPGNGYIVFTGVNPGDIKENTIYQMKPVFNGDYGDYSSDIVGWAPPINYTDTANPTCFAGGTLIETATGKSRIEDLTVGDLIMTMDNGLQQLCWIGNSWFSQEALLSDQKLFPIRIPAGALGDGMPSRALTVSRQHRILVRSNIAQRIFGQKCVLIPAIKLVGYNGIDIDYNVKQASYFHLLFDSHQIVFSEDALTESLYFGTEALKNISRSEKDEITKIVPDINNSHYTPEPARLICQKGRVVSKFLNAHSKHNAPIFTVN